MFTEHIATNLNTHGAVQCYLTTVTALATAPFQDLPQLGVLCRSTSKRAKRLGETGLTLMGDILTLLSVCSLINYKNPPALLAQRIRVQMHGTRIRHRKQTCQPWGRRHVETQEHGHRAKLHSQARDNRLKKPMSHNFTQHSGTYSGCSIKTTRLKVVCQ